LFDSHAQHSMYIIDWYITDLGNFLKCEYLSDHCTDNSALIGSDISDGSFNVVKDVEIIIIL